MQKGSVLLVVSRCQALSLTIQDSRVASWRSNISRDISRGHKTKDASRMHVWSFSHRPSFSSIITFPSTIFWDFHLDMSVRRPETSLLIKPSLRSLSKLGSPSESRLRSRAWLPLPSPLLSLSLSLSLSLPSSSSSLSLPPSLSWSSSSSLSSSSLLPSPLCPLGSVGLMSEAESASLAGTGSDR